MFKRRQMWAAVALIFSPPPHAALLSPSHLRVFSSPDTSDTALVFLHKFCWVHPDRHWDPVALSDALRHNKRNFCRSFGVSQIKPQDEYQIWLRAKQQCLYWRGGRRSKGFLAVICGEKSGFRWRCKFDYKNFLNVCGEAYTSPWISLFLYSVKMC